MTKTRKLLLVSPAFHGYWRAISAAYESLGWDVLVHRYDEHTSVARRAQNKLLHDLPERLRWLVGEELVTSNALRRLRGDRYDAVLVIKGDQLGEAWWSELRGLGIPSIIWLYDEIRRTRFTAAGLRATSPIASYSHRDVAELRGLGIDATHVPLGFDSLLGFAPVASSEVTLVGARYATREELVRDIQATGTPVKAYGREWSRDTWDVVRTRRLRGAGVPAAGDLDRASAYGVMAGSLATLNIHSNQDGFTMRTFEAAGVGALELIDRSDVGELYEVGRELICFASAEEVAEVARRAQLEPHWASAIREAGRRRTLAEHTLVHRASTLEDLWG